MNSIIFDSLVPNIPILCIRILNYFKEYWNGVEGVKTLVRGTLC